MCPQTNPLSSNGLAEGNTTPTEKAEGEEETKKKEDRRAAHMVKDESRDQERKELEKSK